MQNFILQTILNIASNKIKFLKRVDDVGFFSHNPITHNRTFTFINRAEHSLSLDFIATLGSGANLLGLGPHEVAKREKLLEFLAMTRNLGESPQNFSVG